MNFEKNNFLILKQAISKELADFCYTNFKLKKQVFDTFVDKRYISYFDKSFGFIEPENGQIPQTYSLYGDTLMETLLLKVKPIMEKETNLKLNESYAYARLYKKGDELKRHKDRLSCEISTTLNLGGDAWPIYLEPDPTKGEDKEGVGYVSENTPGVEVNLEPGDMLVYKGCILEHWREPFEGNECGQVFLHYNKIDTDNKIYDGRLHLGLPNEPIFKA